MSINQHLDLKEKPGLMFFACPAALRFFSLFPSIQVKLRVLTVARLEIVEKKDAALLVEIYTGVHRIAVWCVESNGTTRGVCSEKRFSTFAYGEDTWR